jgi:cell division protein FtsL
MNIDLEYAIKQDIRNNPVVREVDLDQKRQFNRLIWLTAAIVTMLLFSAWQHFELVNHGYKIEKLRVELAAEESLNRKLRLEVETLRRPQQVEYYALHRLRMVPPSSADMVVIERTNASTPSRSIVASNR